ncbi:hypothetical protein [Halorubrum laminariae]|uniref:GerMN domain-containing protein n=1 Tax=Halorubrum laminariae TaxID=1433523 RepID=A0ABD6C0W6_9EURY|nr:hypothetical protein [Halorubrum laminariae]
MHRRAVVVGVLTVATAGCTDRLRDVAASTPRDIAVRSRYVDGNPLTEGQSIRGLPAELHVHAASYRSHDGALGALRPDAIESRSFVDATEFVDGGGEAILVVAQRLTAPEVELRLGSISRIGDGALRVALDESGPDVDVEKLDDPVVKTLLLRLIDRQETPTRVVVSVDGDRAGVTI